MVEATVMIAAWNAADTIARSVESASAQSGIRTEVIVVDDASSDATAACAEAVSATVLRLSRNGGPSVARNRAIEAARGDWIAVLDSDDAMLPGRLRRMADLGAEMQADIVLGNLRKVDPAGKELEASAFLAGAKYGAPRAWSLEELMAEDQAMSGGKSVGYLKPLFRRAFLVEHGLRYDPRLRNGEDFHIVLAGLAAGGRVVFSPAPDYLYTVRRGSISHRIDPAHIAALIVADRDFVALNDAVLSPRARALFAARAAALHELKVSEEILQALKARRVKEAIKKLLQQPAIAKRVGRQLLEAVRNRARHARPSQQFPWS